MRSAWQNSALNVVRGGLIGTVEVVPGVSGGTVALVLGIYETIITSAGHVVSGLRRAIIDVPRRRGLRAARVELRQAHWPTIVPVAAGMLTALVLAARVIESFIHDHPEHSRGLFLGLVAAGLYVPAAMVGRRWTASYALAAAAAAAGAFVVTGLPPTEVTPSPFVIVLAAAAAVCALVLPGLSGSFVLLTIGMYEPTLSALNARELGYLAWFVAGVIMGLSSFVKVLQWLLEHRRYLTLAVLTGLMAGSMRALWPWQTSDRTLLAPAGNAGSVLLLTVAGIAAVVIVVLVTHQRQPSRPPTGLPEKTR